MAVSIWTITAIAIEAWDRSWTAIFVATYAGPIVSTVLALIGIGYLLIRAPDDWVLVLFTALAIPCASTLVIYVAPVLIPT